MLVVFLGGFGGFPSCWYFLYAWHWHWLLLKNRYRLRSQGNIFLGSRVFFWSFLPIIGPGVVLHLPVFLMPWDFLRKRTLHEDEETFWNHSFYFLFQVGDEVCEAVLKGQKLLKCLPNAWEAKVALELRKLSLEIEKLEQERRKKEVAWGFLLDTCSGKKLQYQYTSPCRRVLATLTQNTIFFTLLISTVVTFLFFDWL